VVLVGFYPRVTAALFVHFFWFFPVIAMTAMLLTLWMFYVHYYRAQNRARPLNIVAGLAAAVFILMWQTILTGIDQFMVTGGPAGDPVLQDGSGISNIGSALYSLFSPTFIPMNIHRIFGNLSWPAFAVAAWAAFSYRTAKSAEDKAFFDWAGSMGVIWGTVFLLLQPFAGFAIALAMKLGSSGPYERLTGSEGATFTSNLLWINLTMVVGLFVLANAAMYLGAQRHPDLSGQRPIRFFGLVAALAGLYSISPLAQFPFLYMRYIMILIMVLATVGALVAYVRGRRQFRYGNPSGRYLAVLLALGVLAAVVTASMGWMKSNSRAPYAIYGQPEYNVNSETPVTPEQFNQETPRVLGTPKSEETPRAKEG